MQWNPLNLTHKHTALLGGLLAALLLCAAYSMEYIFTWPPCTLCWWQRYGLMFSVISALIAFMLPSHARLLLVGVALGFLTSGGLGFYHMGVEQGWWVFESGCTSGLSMEGSLDDLRTAILEAPVIRCDEPVAIIFGISLAVWNALFSTAVGLGLIITSLMKPAS